MTLGVSIPLEAKGGSQVNAEFNKVADGVHRVATAENHLAAAAHKRGQAVKDANAHGYQTAHARGDHGGFVHSLHIAGMAGGELGHLGHKFGRAARFGGAGLAVAGIGLAASGIMESLEAFDERAAEIVKKSAEIAVKMHEARKAFGESALGSANANGSSIARLGVMGASFGDIKKAQGMGLDPGAMADIWGTKNRAGGMATAAAARRFGMDPAAAAKAIAAMGGVRDGSDAYENAAYLAGREQNHRYSKEEIARARAGGGSAGGAIQTIRGFQDRAAVAGIDGIETGKAGAAAADHMNRAISPEAYAMTEAWKKATEESEVLNEIAAGQSRLLAFWQNMSSAKGNAEVRAIRATNIDAAALMSGGPGGASE
jgi:hypothetical protein